MPTTVVPVEQLNTSDKKGDLLTHHRIKIMKG